MESNLYSIRDNVAKIFNKPFLEHNHNSARRAFAQGLKDNPNPEDYSLYHIGKYDDQLGCIFPKTEPEKLESGLKPNVSSITPEMQRKDLGE